MLVSSTYNKATLFLPFLYVTGAPPVSNVLGSKRVLVAFTMNAFCASVVHVLRESQNILCMLMIPWTP